MQNFTPGWNDPPSMARNSNNSGSSSNTSSVRNLLTKRVAFPISGNVPNVSQAAPVDSAIPFAPPSTFVTNDSAVPFAPPSTFVTNDSSETTFQSAGVENADNDSIANIATAVVETKIPDTILTFTNEEILNVLRTALESCLAIPAPSVENISRRLEKLNQALGQASLSVPCRQKLCTLVNAVKEARHSDAYNTHSVMVVDHFAEVNQWMVGVKALILECQKRGS